MDHFEENNANHDAAVAGTVSSAYVPPLQLTEGQPPPIAANGGLSYTSFEYGHIRVNRDEIELGESVTVSTELTNRGEVAGAEVVQLYTRDLAASVTRPVKELKGFQRVQLEPGQSEIVEFELHTDELAFYGRDMKLVTEAGAFDVWIGGSSATELRSSFRIIQG